MKRTPITRKTPLTARKPMQRRCREPKRGTQRGARWRSEPYLAWVRARNCCHCGAPGCDPHHVIGLGWGLSGAGLTAPDSFAMPLCRTCHGKVHESTELQQNQPQWLEWTLRAALDSRNALSCEIRDELTHALAFIQAKEAK